MGLDNKIQQAFDNIQADPRLIESTKQALAAKRSKKARKKTGMILTLACMALSFAAGMQAYSWIQTPISYVSIDVNPSMELALNRLDRVVFTSSYNDEGAEILDGLPLKGKKYTDAIKIIMESSTMGTYLTADPELLFTVASDKEREITLETGITDASRETGHNCHSVSADMETAALAHDSGLSIGKYNAYLLLLQYGAAITIDQCKDMSISELYALIQEFQQEEIFQEEITQEEEIPQEEPPQDEVPQVSEENGMDDINNISTHHQEEQHHGGHH